MSEWWRVVAREGGAWVERLGQDLRYALRMLRRSPGFTAVAVLSLALGIGVNTSIFAFIHAILLRPLPVAEPARLVAVYHRNVRQGWLSSSSYPDYEHYRDHSEVFSGMLAYLRVPMMLRRGELAERVSGELVSADYFSMLGLRAALGRTFAPEEGRAAGASPVVVLSHDLWQRRLGGDPGVVGRTVTIARHAFTVIGVAPRGFRGLVLDWGKPPELWVPVTMYREAVPALADIDVLHLWGMHSFLILGRLRPGVTFERAQAAMATLAARATPERDRGFKRESGYTAELSSAQQARFWPAYRGSVVLFLTMLAAVVGVVLLIACFNLANLLLARAARRQREIAVRLSLGAGRGRLVRQFLTESFLLSLVGGVAGLAVAAWTTGFLASFHDPFKIPLSLDTGLDAPVIGFALLLAVLTGALFGVLPALQAPRVNLTSALKVETAGGGPRRLALRSGLVVAQVALSVVLLVGAGLFVRTLRNATLADPTLDPGNVLLARLDPLTQGYDEARVKSFYPRLLERIQALPGVRSAALVWIVPLGGMRGGTDIVTESRERPGEKQTTQVDYNVISPDYFATVGLPVLRGRAFTDRDREGALPVAIVNEQLARRFWPREDPMGKRFRLTGRGSQEVEVEVVGVVRDGRFRNFRQPIRPCFYLSLWQHSRGEMSLEVRAAGDPALLIAAVRAEVRALDKDLLLPEILTLKSHRDLGLSQERLTAALLGGLGLLALALVAIGTYGVISFSVAQRTREIGIRLALGARTSEVLRMVLRQGLAPVLAGLGIGLAAALALGCFIASLLYEVRPADPLTLAVTGSVLIAVALVACLLPARRASKVDPVEALRYE